MSRASVPPDCRASVSLCCGSCVCAVVLLCSHVAMLCPALTMRRLLWTQLALHKIMNSWKEGKNEPDGGDDKPVVRAVPDLPFHFCLHPPACVS